MLIAHEAWIKKWTIQWTLKKKQTYVCLNKTGIKITDIQSTYKMNKARGMEDHTIYRHWNIHQLPISPKRKLCASLWSQSNITSNSNSVKLHRSESCLLPYFSEHLPDWIVRQWPSSHRCTASCELETEVGRPQRQAWLPALSAPWAHCSDWERRTTCGPSHHQQADRFLWEIRESYLDTESRKLHILKLVFTELHG